MRMCFFFFSSRRRHTRCSRDWSSDVCSSDLDFIAAYKAKYNADPDQFAAQSYTAMLVLIEAMKKTTRMSDKEQVKKALESVSLSATPLGAFSFTPEHDVKQPTFVMTVKDKQFVPFQ